MDAWLGVPLLLLLGNLIPRRGPHGQIPKRPRRILCIKLLGIGSTVLALPLMEKLKEEGNEVAFLGFGGPSELVRWSGIASHVFSTSRFFRAIAGVIRFRPDVVLDLEPTSNLTAALSVLLLSPIRIGFMAGKKGRERVFTHLVSVSRQQHMAELYFEFAKILGMGVEGRAKLPNLERKERSGCRRIALNMHCGDLSKLREWEPDRWLELAGLLLCDPNVEIWFTGLKRDRSGIVSLKERLNSNRVHTNAGATSLPELIEFLGSCDLVVSVDSGLAHLAALAGVETITLFGPETPDLFSPRSPRARSIYQKLPCSPCLSIANNKMSSCKENLCMQTITAPMVLSQVHFREAIILAGGLGTRLAGVVNGPKPMAPVLGIPFLEHQIQFLARAGVEHVVLSVAFQAEKIISHFRDQYRDLRISYSLEDEPLGTGGALLRAGASLKMRMPFLVTNGDSYFDIDLNEMWNFHRERMAAFTMSLTEQTDSERFMAVHTNDQGKVLGFRGEATGSFWANGGIYILDRDALSCFGEPSAPVSLERELLPLLVKQSGVYGIRFRSAFIDIGMPADYKRAHCFFRSIETGISV